VTGLVCGAIFTQDLVIGRRGQVWGDVLAAALRLEKGGRLVGWHTTLAPGGYEALQNEEVTMAEAVARSATPTEGIMGGDWVAFDSPASRLAALRQLQVEAGAAMAANAEKDRTFGRRPQESAAGAIAETQRLREQLRLAQEAIAGLEARVAELAAAVRVREQQNVNHVRRLEALQQQLAERTHQQEVWTPVADAFGLELATPAAVTESAGGADSPAHGIMAGQTARSEVFQDNGATDLVAELAERARLMAEKDWAITHQQETIDRLERRATVLEAQVVGLRTQAASAADERERHEQAVVALEIAQNRVAELEARALAGAPADWHNQLRQSQLQLEAFAAEIERYCVEIDEQRERYAATQVALAERELACRELEAQLTAERQNIARLKQAALIKIRGLEEALAETRGGRRAQQ
jgi:hypothetical protein